MVNIIQRHIGVPQTSFNGTPQLLKQRLTGLLILSQRQVHDVRPIPDGTAHTCLIAFGESALAFFSGLSQLPHGTQVKLIPVDPGPFQEQVEEQCRKILAPEEIVSRNGVDLHDGAKQLQYGHIKGTAAKVKHQVSGILLFRHSICDGRGSRFVNDPGNLQSCQLPCPFGRFSLHIVEVSRNTDDGFCHFLAKEAFRVFLQAPKDQAGKLFCPKLPAAKFIFPVGSHAPFENAGAFKRMKHRPFFGGFTDKYRSAWGHAYNGRGQMTSEAIGNDLCLAIAKAGGQAVCGS